MNNIMDENYGLYAVIFVVIVVAIFVYSHFKGKANLKKAATGEDKARFEAAVRNVMGEGNYTIAYAHHEDVQYYGRSRKTTYYYYALAFDEARLWIMPVRFEKELVLPDKPVLATDDMLGIVDVSERINKKTGTVECVVTTLNDKNGKKLVELTVDAENTKEDRFHHLNLLQPDECAQFYGFISAMSGQVQAANADLPDRLKAQANAKNGKNATIEAVIGIVMGVIFPLIGLILGIAAIITAPKLKANGGKLGMPLILGLVATVVSLVFLCLGSPVSMLILALFTGGE